MIEFETKRRLRKKIYSKVSVGLIALVALFLIKPTWNVYLTKNESERKADELRLEIAKAEERKSELESNIQKLQTERGIEEEIRDKYNVVKEGEKMVVIVEDDEGIVDQEVVKRSSLSRTWLAIKSFFWRW